MILDPLMILGIVVGIIGFACMGINYPIYKRMLEKEKRRMDRMVMEGYAYYKDDIYSDDDIELTDDYDKEIKEYKFVIQKDLPKYKTNKKIKVLVGDYDLMSISNTIRVLKSMGIETKAAKSGREIIKRIKKSGMFELIKNGTVETTILDNLSICF